MELCEWVRVGPLEGPRRDVHPIEVSLWNVARPAHEGEPVLDHDADARRDGLLVGPQPGHELGHQPGMIERSLVAVLKSRRGELSQSGLSWSSTRLLRIPLA